MKTHVQRVVSKRVNVFGRSLSVFLIALLAMTGVATAAVLTMYGSVDGTANVNQAITLDNKTCDGTDGSGCVTTADFNGSVSAGTTVIETHTVTSQADVDADIGFETSCENSADADTNSPTTTRDINWSDSCNGITTKIVEYFDAAGHDFSNYSSLSTSEADIVVSDGNDLQTRIDDASSGDTVLVEAGSYDGTIDVTTTDLTIVANNAPDSGNAATVTGGKKGFEVTASGVTIKGFDIEATDNSDGPNSRGVDVLADSVTVDSNKIHNVRSESRTYGVFVFGNNDPVNDVVVTNNYVHNVKATSVNGDGTQFDESKSVGLKILSANGKSSNNIEFTHNTIENIGDDTDSAMANGISISGGTAEDFIVQYNEISQVNHNEDNGYTPTAGGVYVTGYDSSSEGYGTDHAVTRNNILLANTQETADIKDWDGDRENTEFNATNNYWDIDGIQLEQQDVMYDSSTDDILVSWRIKNDLTIESGTTDTFGVVNDFAINLMQDEYSIATDILPQ